jgi:hypothetical protein
MMTNTTDFTSQSSGSGDTMTEQVKQQTQQTAQQVQQTASQAVDTARQQATSVAAGRKDQTAQSLSSVAQALRQSGQQLQDQGQGPAGQVMDRAADSVERFSGYLQSRTINDIIAEVENVARRQPVAFVGGALAIGFALSRFLKSSPPSSGGQAGQYGSYSRYYGGYEGGYGSTRYPGQYGSVGMQEGFYAYSDVDRPYEDAGGTSEFRRGYGQGLTEAEDGTSY